MKLIYVAQKERFERVVAFAESDEHKAYFPADKPAGQRIAALKQVIAKLGALGGTQVESGRGAQAATGQKDEILQSLWADLVGLARVARALDDERPELEARFKTPSRKSEQAILDAAQAALNALQDDETLSALFIDEGMPGDFVEDLQEDLQAALAANRAQDEHTGARQEDTLAIAQQINTGVNLLEKLDAYAKNRFRDDAVLLGAWKAASHLEMRRARRGGQDTQPSTPPAS